MKNKKFIFVGTNIFRNNAFFINEDFKDKISFEIKDYLNLENFVNANFRESRDIRGNLSYLDPHKIIESIKDCEVVDLSTTPNMIKKISEVFKFNIK